MEVAGVFVISGYGLFVALGFIAAYGSAFVLARRSATIRIEHIDRVLLWAMIPAVIAARLLFVMYHLDYFVGQPAEIVAVWHGGWVWHGALAGGLLGIALYCKRAGTGLLPLLDILAPGATLGQAIGRWGNYINQEAYGLPTNVPWGIGIDEAHRLPGFDQFSTFHPTFLYESIFDGVLFLFLGWLFLTRLDPGLRRDDTGGVIFFLYLLLYSLVRFCIEFMRIDTVPIVVGLRAPQWISIVLMGVGIAGLVRVLRKQKKLVY